MGAVPFQRCSFLRCSVYSTSTDRGGAKDEPAAQQEAQERGKDMNLARSFNNWRKYRQTVNELGRMTDRELRDLGIGRSDIPYIARKASN